MEGGKGWECNANGFVPNYKYSRNKRILQLEGNNCKSEWAKKINDNRAVYPCGKRPPRSLRMRLKIK